MSKIRFGRMLDIANCTGEQLTNAVTKLAEMLGAKVVHEVRDYFNRNPQRVTAGIALPHSGLRQRTIGFVVQDGRVRPVGDDFGWNAEYANVQNLLRQTYNTMSMEQKLRHRGYQIQSRISVVGGLTGKVQAHVQGTRL